MRTRRLTILHIACSIRSFHELSKNGGADGRDGICVERSELGCRGVKHVINGVGDEVLAVTERGAQDAQNCSGGCVGC
jgi:hypothetical protein